MKLLFGVLLIALTVCDVWTLPAGHNPQDDAEVIPVRRTQPVDPDFRDYKGVIDTGAIGNPFLQSDPSSDRFNLAFATTFANIFAGLRSRFFPVLTTLGDDSSDNDSSSEGGSPFLSLTPVTALSGKKANTTSTVKVIDGHKVVINETVYGDSDGDSVFRVRVVNVRPLESGEVVNEGVSHSQDDAAKPALVPTTSAPSTRSELDDLADAEDNEDRREKIEKQTNDNEVISVDEPKRTTQPTTTTTTTTASKLASSSPIEATAGAAAAAEDSIADATDKQHTVMAEPADDMQQQQEEQLQQQQQQQLELEVVEEVEDAQQQQLAAAQEAATMAHNEETEMSPYDGDSHNAAPESLAAIENFGDELLVNPQSEQLQLQLRPQLDEPYREREDLESSGDDEEGESGPFEMSDTFNDEWASLDADADSNNDFNNHIDVYENFVPADLSNDIAVNDIAAANPDFPYNPDAELINRPVAMQTLSKFEKLSLTPPTSSPTPLMK